MLSTVYNPNWENESLRWQQYDQEVSHQTNKKVYELIVNNLGEPARLKPYFPAIITGISNLLEDNSDPDSAVQITAALGVWPERWGYGAAWETQVRQALDCAEKAGKRLQPQRSALLATLAEMLYFSSKLEAAKTLAREAIRLARITRSPETLSLGMKTEIAVRWLETEAIPIQEEIQAFESELEQWGIPDTDIQRYSICLKIMHVLILRSNGEVNLARDTAWQLVELIQQIDKVDVHFIADCYQICGVMEWANGRMAEAQKSYEKAAELYTRAGASTMMAYIDANLSLALLSQGRLVEGSEASLRSIELNAKINNPIRYVNAYGLLGMSYYLAGRFKEAADIFKRQIKLAAKTGNSRSHHLAIDNKFSLMVMQGKYQQAVPGLLKSLEYYKTIKSKERQLGIEIDLLLCYKAQNDFAQAEFYASSIENLLASGGLERNIVVAQRAISFCRPPSEARKRLESAYNLAVQSGYLLEQAACLLLLTVHTADPTEKLSLWQKAASLCQTCGASAWLKGRSVEDPPFLPFII